MGSSGEPMTSERLAAIQERVTSIAAFYDIDVDASDPDLPHDYICDVEALLADNERLRAENGELREMAASLRVQYAAFQQRHGERSGGDGQQR